ncbi:hypothetical protein OEB99_13110 [Actinotalea sp. M2MS4P-6]|uniref:hypothetical protein n=1 Tax=Actinotalea sp. M2MS4P-6 TaxID=2983762 RepID=UPI0021E451B3|nr:hypothetical protein [Actinotalea sp. M2MS4P-6]MCV2395251.1 hypothetical protein [Actinotalea sp. M2MS4P-6]
MLFSQVSLERAQEFCDHVRAREPYFLREVATWMAATGGPIDSMDASAESLVELWQWFVRFVDMGMPGVSSDVRPADLPEVKPSENIRRTVAGERLGHYVRLVVGHYDPPAGWAVKVSRPGQPRDAFEHITGIQRSDGEVPDFEYVRIAARRASSESMNSRDPDRLLRLVQMRFPKVAEGEPRGKSVLAHYLAADLGPMPPEAAVTPVLRWTEEPEPVPAPSNPVLVKQPQLVLIRGPAAGLEDPRLLEPLDEQVVAAALGELGYRVDGRVPTARDLRVDEASFIAQDEHWYSEVSVAVHRRRLRLVDVDQTAATAEHWDRLVARLRALAGQLGAALGEPDDFDVDIDA